MSTPHDAVLRGLFVPSVYGYSCVRTCSAQADIAYICPGSRRVIPCHKRRKVLSGPAPRSVSAAATVHVGCSQSWVHQLIARWPWLSCVMEAEPPKRTSNSGSSVSTLAGRLRRFSAVAQLQDFPNCYICSCRNECSHTTSGKFVKEHVDPSTVKIMLLPQRSSSSSSDLLLLRIPAAARWARDSLMEIFCGSCWWCDINLC